MQLFDVDSGRGEFSPFFPSFLALTSSFLCACAIDSTSTYLALSIRGYSELVLTQNIKSNRFSSSQQSDSIAEMKLTPAKRVRDGEMDEVEVEEQQPVPATGKNTRKGEKSCFSFLLALKSPVI